MLCPGLDTLLNADPSVGTAVRLGTALVVVEIARNYTLYEFYVQLCKMKTRDRPRRTRSIRYRWDLASIISP